MDRKPHTMTVADYMEAEMAEKPPKVIYIWKPDLNHVVKFGRTNEGVILLEENGHEPDDVKYILATEAEEPCETVLWEICAECGANVVYDEDNLQCGYCGSKGRVPACQPKAEPKQCKERCTCGGNDSDCTWCGGGKREPQQGEVVACGTCLKGPRQTIGCSPCNDHSRWESQARLIKQGEAGDWAKRARFTAQQSDTSRWGIQSIAGKAFKEIDRLTDELAEAKQETQVAKGKAQRKADAFAGCHAANTLLKRELVEAKKHTEAQRLDLIDKDKQIVALGGLPTPKDPPRPKNMKQHG